MRRRQAWKPLLVAGFAAFAAALAPTGTATPTTASCKAGYYRNAGGHCVHSPSSSPVGATARCRDGTYSYSEHASGTCSHHGGVLRWLHRP